ncbi:MAG: O-antigen ligase family protein [Elusimicrobia bacterium]|nr:O-antigen ligase family protein [Elusimicrobiota bacterium]
MSLRSITSFLKCGVYFLFVFSGLLKPFDIFPIDATILFGIPTALILMSSVMLRRHRFIPEVRPAILYSLAFLLWYLGTSAYSISSTFVHTKALSIILNIITFIFPLLCFKKTEDFSSFTFWLAFTGLIAIAIILNMYRTDTIGQLLAKGKAGETHDYLTIGTTIGLGILTLLSRPTLTSIGIAMMGGAAIALVGARGPFLFLLMTVAIYLMIRHGRVRVFNRRTVGSLAFGAVLLFALLQWEGAGFLRQRIVGGWEESLEKALRLPLFLIALQIIFEHPLLGVGLGGYGLAAYGIDEHNYPHNLFLEAFAETGVFGFLLFSLGLLRLLQLTPMAIKSRTGTYLLMLATYMMFNFSKSGGFTSARYLYVFLGLLLAWLNGQALSSPSLHARKTLHLPAARRA